LSAGENADGCCVEERLPTLSAEDEIAGGDWKLKKSLPDD